MSDVVEAGDLLFLAFFEGLTRNYQGDVVRDQNNENEA